MDKRGQINEYLKGEQASPLERHMFGNMTLEELRQYFQNDQQSFKELQAKAMQKREGEVAAEVETLKKEKQLLRLSKAKDDQELTELLTVLDQRKEKELRAKIEKDKIMGELQGLDRSKLSHLETEKKRELERLAAEREALRQKEEDIMNEISGLQTRIKDRETGLTREKEGLGQRKGKTPESQALAEIHKKESEYAKERGERVADLKYSKCPSSVDSAESSLRPKSCESPRTSKLSKEAILRPCNAAVDSPAPSCVPLKVGSPVLSTLKPSSDSFGTRRGSSNCDSRSSKRPRNCCPR